MKFSATLISALSVATASAAAIQERAGTLFTITDFKAACTSSTSCSYSFEYAIGTGTTGSSTACSTTLSTTGGKLPDIATKGARCGGITYWFTRTSEGLKVYNSLQITYTSRTGSYVIPTSELSTSGGFEHYTGPTTFALS
ncbi:hypothetical protein BCIN_06g00540 [Botrytis cinerea B05.10]|uniref:Small secreted protein n=2 Tax=Botryotinia fuckeliana TaxID=40559 RepID=A0A384JJI9_BOTFB|nr:hypothetical protein BCIN_06g00540 [Botrytis cinerea B05.10]ATZ50557.1 hypothetical protein BCIN_06g00540 [Botrytis cinerea B05.10]CCD49280.1 hypothetical protein BofuT4P22000049001 [Botrytis cinerea T4]